MLGPNVEGHTLGFELYIDPSVGGLRSDVAELFIVRDVEFGVDIGSHSLASPSVASPSASSSAPGIASTSTMPGHGLTLRDTKG